MVCPGYGSVVGTEFVSRSYGQSTTIVIALIIVIVHIVIIVIILSFFISFFLPFFPSFFQRYARHVCVVVGQISTKRRRIFYSTTPNFLKAETQDLNVTDLLSPDWRNMHFCKSYMDIRLGTQNHQADQVDQIPNRISM